MPQRGYSGTGSLEKNFQLLATFSGIFATLFRVHTWRLWALRKHLLDECNERNSPHTKMLKLMEGIWDSLEPDSWLSGISDKMTGTELHHREPGNSLVKVLSGHLGARLFVPIRIPALLKWWISTNLTWKVQCFCLNSWMLDLIFILASPSLRW